MVFLFSGQGQGHAANSGSITRDPVYTHWLRHCADLLREVGFSRDLLTLLNPSSKDFADLTQTEFAQPALFATEYAMAQFWEHRGVRPEADDWAQRR